MSATGRSGASCCRTLMVTLVATATAVTRVFACNFDGHVDTTSHTLSLTCHCKTSDTNFPMKRLQMLKINQKSLDYLERYRLAWLNMEKNETDKYAKNFTVSIASISTDRKSAKFTLNFDLNENHRSRQTLDFECVAMGLDNDHWPTEKAYYFKYRPSDYYKTTTTTTTTTPPPTTTTTTTTSQPTTTRTAKDDGLAWNRVKQTGVRRRRQNPAPSHPPPASRYPEDCVPLDLERHLLEAVTSQNGRGPRHVTPSLSLSWLSQSDHTVPSGSYALCNTPSSSIHALPHRPLQNQNVTVAKRSRDVGGHVTPRNVLVGDVDVEDADQTVFSPVWGPRHSEQPFSPVDNTQRRLPPLFPSCSPPLAGSSRDRKSRRFSPPKVHISPTTPRKERRPLIPPSPEPQRLPMEPSPPRAFPRTRAVPGDEEADWEELSESGSWGSNRESEGMIPPDTVGEAEAGAHELCHLYESDVTYVRRNEGGVRLNEGGVRLNEGGIRLNEGGGKLNEGSVRLDVSPVSVQEGLSGVFGLHVDPTYLNPV